MLPIIQLPPRSRHAGVAVLRVEAGLFFGNADHVRDMIENAATPEYHRTVSQAVDAARAGEA